MLAITKSIALQGLDGYLISIQVDISAGMPHFEIVGLPDTSVRESKERVKTAIKNSGAEFLSRKIVINLAPANTRKEGSGLDLAIAVGILTASGYINMIANEEFDSTIFVGELSLNGNIEKINGILPICIEAKKLGIKRIILPKENAGEASYISGIEIIPVETLEEVMQYLNKEKEIKPEISRNILNENKQEYLMDFSEVKGQENVKRALEISAAGGHNCMLIRSTRLRKNNACKKVTNDIARFKF